MTDELIEQVARVIYEEDDPWHTVWPWPDLQSDQAGVDQYRRIARAALAAINLPARLEALQQRVRELEEAAHMAMLELGSHGACPACFNAHSTLRNALTKPEGLK